MLPRYLNKINLTEYSDNTASLQYLTIVLFWTSRKKMCLKEFYITCNYPEGGPVARNISVVSDGEFSVKAFSLNYNR